MKKQCEQCGTLYNDNTVKNCPACNFGKVDSSKEVKKNGKNKRFNYDRTKCSVLTDKEIGDIKKGKISLTEARDLHRKRKPFIVENVTGRIRKNKKANKKKKLERHIKQVCGLWD